MTKNKDIEKGYRFVIRNFKEGVLLPDKGWERFKLTHRISTFKRYVAAASIAAVVLAASASLYFYSTETNNPETGNTVLTPIEETAKSTDNRIEKIEFHDATLKDVVAEIERIYGVTITNVPQEEIRLTISYEGTAADAVETINDLLNTNLIVSPKISNKK